MPLRLTILTHSVRRTHYIEAVPCVIGRDPLCDVTLPYQEISRWHVRIDHHDGHYTIEDLGSTNGTYLNGEPIQLQQVIEEGDVFHLGQETRLEISFHGDDLRQTSSRNLSPVGTSTERRAAEKADKSESAIHDANTLKVLLEISKSLTESLDTKVVLDRVIDAVVELVEVDRGFILLNRDGEYKVVVARNNQKQPLPPEEWRVSTSVVKEILRLDRPTTVFDAQEDSVLSNQQSVADLKLNTVIGVPLRVQHKPGATTADGESDEPIGLIYADSTRSNPKQAQKIVDLLSAMAGHAANAIQNATFHEQLIDQEKLQMDLDIAREIQESLLPGDLGRFGGYDVAAESVPLRQVGGDYYAARQHPSGMVELCIADVMGKGIPAALMMGVVHAGFSALRMRMTPLPEMVADLNRLIANQRAKNKYITFFFAQISGGNLEYINAGHNPPLLVRSNGTHVLLDEGGMMLGVVDDATYISGVVPVEPGDTILLYTDGLVEATNSDGEPFGEVRVLNFLHDYAHWNAPEILQRLKAELFDFTNGQPLRDDLTLLVCKVLVPGL